jgi:hypothetical protein
MPARYVVRALLANEGLEVSQVAWNGSDLPEFFEDSIEALIRNSDLFVALHDHVRDA